MLVRSTCRRCGRHADSPESSDGAAAQIPHADWCPHPATGAVVERPTGPRPVAYTLTSVSHTRRGYVPTWSLEPAAAAAKPAGLEPAPLPSPPSPPPAPWGFRPLPLDGDEDFDPWPTKT